jgi:hypothetical protein
MKYPPDLIVRVRASLDRAGYCFLNCDEIRRLLAGVPARGNARHQVLRIFAEICGAQVETTDHLKSARFIPAKLGPGHGAEDDEIREAAAA